jgi:hypothetical protein
LPDVPDGTALASTSLGTIREPIVEQLKGNREEKKMKRTVTILTAALFVSALAMPAFAQSPEASPAAAPSMAAPEASPAMAAPEASPESAATEKKEEMAEHHHKKHHRKHHHKAAAMSEPAPETGAPAPETAPSTEAPAPMASPAAS